MGNIFSRLLGDLENSKEKILLVGLDAAGKTTFLYKMKLGEVSTDIFSIGFIIESIEYKNIQFSCWDVGGEDKIRPLYRSYYQDSTAIIFMVDSNDRDRISEARTELFHFVRDEFLSDVPLLVIANKQDLPNSMPVEEVTEKMGLHQIKEQRWMIQPCCSTSGDGIYEGLDWLVSALRARGVVLKPAKQEKE